MKVNNQTQKYKLVNQFCYSDFLNFITNVYLSNNNSPSDLNNVLRSKRIQNLREFQEMINQMINHHPQIRNSSHFLSNLIPFETFLRQIDLGRFSYRMIKNKFFEFFDSQKNTNKNYVSNISQSYLGSESKYSYQKKSYPHSIIQTPSKIGKVIFKIN